ncbi:MULTISPECIES: bifunctional riboflavin kinase/FAD synthetase [Paenarthrobacter]|jgi:riboflavin kinase/FMN adenylyltransferase|uniref:Riboflavin biosynthesis protein n=1 Tax=Paenarthrobacter nicotinovorans TaxID=29320 RepID=A0ABT9TR12_PAENI|nr:MULTISPECIES: bifunctional riboflavin kinase/FAD synthetase [Paenarthrobacter]KIA73717.1 riboflavin biosynthesis protein RibF [Arthrobacter sp. MWB30]KQQ97918.1 bifunctional riboflavin kinase/FMN adenylyltransferase [Arthrobacter sp. Leaf145]SKB89073.1 riboflavin kinase / FMN adenylyltransferase [Arthrobacter sp. 31Cvi3.1E]BCW39977.1 riboflavin biosynthesis protein [Arthrobacter sp. StoSoilB3]MBP2393101.1 riboflavin kinase/FMN adenylyltransferase [Paenarthrobacter nicotinovorans]
MVHIWNDPTEVPKDFGPTVVTIGNFDGVHRGHQHVLSQLTDTAKRYSIPSVAVTFDPHPAQVHRPDAAPELIMGLQDKLEALGDTGVDAVLVMKYTLDLAAMSPIEFVRDVLIDGLHAAHVVVGHDLRFGAGNVGDVVTMQELGEQLGFGVQVVNEYGAGGFPLHHDGDADRRCSSTWVREALSEGDVVTAAAVLGRPHRMRGEVVHGAARGRDLGFPTANLSPDSTGYIPADGIYAGWLIDQSGTRWPAAISVGSNPTFDGVSRQVEAHVIDRPEENVEDFDLYGQTVAVEFTRRLRGMVAYRGPEALVEQMCLDVAQARELLAPS